MVIVVINNDSVMMAVPSVLCRLILNSGTQVIVLPHFPLWLEPQACILPHPVYWLYSTFILVLQSRLSKGTETGQMAQSSVSASSHQSDGWPHGKISPTLFLKPVVVSPVCPG